MMERRSTQPCVDHVIIDVDHVTMCVDHVTMCVDM